MKSEVKNHEANAEKIEYAIEDLSRAEGAIAGAGCLIDMAGSGLNHTAALDEVGSNLRKLVDSIARAKGGIRDQSKQVLASESEAVALSKEEGKRIRLAKKRLPTFKMQMRNGFVGGSEEDIAEQAILIGHPSRCCFNSTQRRCSP